MASPLPTRKQSVDLGSGEVRVSRIRRDPPPAVKPKELRHPDEVDRTAAVVGILIFAVVICVLVFAFGSYSGWTLKEYRLELRSAE